MNDTLIARARRAMRWHLRDGAAMLRFTMLRACGRVLVPEYRFKWPQLDWWNDRAFDAYLERFDELRAPNTDRRFMLYQLLRLVENVPGDTAECGVFRGASSWMIASFLQRHGRDHRHFVFDTFEGLSGPGEGDGAHWEQGDLACSEDEVRRNLSSFDNIEYLKGWIPRRFDEVADRRFRFVHVDVDLEQPTHDSVAFFLPRLEPGGVLACDDYGSSTCPGATRAIDELLAGKPEKMIALPDGGGFLVKGTRTAPPFLSKPASP